MSHRYTPEALAAMDRAAEKSLAEIKAKHEGKVAKAQAKKHYRKCKREQDPFMHRRAMKRFKEERLVA